METDDFRAIVNHRLLQYRPELREWVASQSDETRRAWADLFVDVHAADLVAACKDIISGRETEPYRREQFASQLLAIARRHAAERLRLEARERELEVAKTYGRAPRGSGGIESTMERAGMLEQYRWILQTIDGEFAERTLANARQRMDRAKELAGQWTSEAEQQT